MRHLRRILTVLLAVASIPAAAAERVLVVELFSSQACPSCPTANAVLADLAQGDATLLPLDLHVTYFDRAGWKDGYSFPGASQRQRRYATQLRTPGVYTPEIVVGGRHEAPGYDAGAVQAAVEQARGEAGAEVALRLERDPAGLRVSAGAGHGQGTLWLVGYDLPARHGRGVNTVRTLQAVADWHGAAVSLTSALPYGDRAAVLLQDESGAILSAAILR